MRNVQILKLGAVYFPHEAESRKTVGFFIIKINTQAEDFQTLKLG